MLKSGRVTKSKSRRVEESKSRRVLALAPLVVAVLLAGCGGEEKVNPPTPNVDGSKYILSSEPEGAVGVRKVREDSKDQDDVVVIGRIGGMEIPWVEGIAAFSIVDPEMKPCNEIGDDSCLKPWDYC